MEDTNYSVSGEAQGGMFLWVMFRDVADDVEGWRVRLPPFAEIAPAGHRSQSPRMSPPVNIIRFSFGGESGLPSSLHLLKEFKLKLAGFMPELLALSAISGAVLFSIMCTKHTKLPLLYFENDFMKVVSDLGGTLEVEQI